MQDRKTDFICWYNSHGGKCCIFFYQSAQLDTLASAASCAVPVKTVGIANTWRASVFVKMAGQGPTVQKVRSHLSHRLDLV